ncbi:ricin-type beta-trefoil lectin domain protein [Streptomyces antimicrobicus]|uniref:Ricin-type beta-trefoil lectin domain protein n=1 Tax=Streptomyces antimicrobicus TaxID=2883108 RepID=A0ABS8B2T2_9ACTN|nr:ricin-type beta-trefoil lectin domain protein [Streptomyces antimicrobicus]MCB5178919.1 ricin-type beta-trefoil lectin domain protein [Streptomyces antimicrobicus]
MAVTDDRPLQLLGHVLALEQREIPWGCAPGAWNQTWLPTATSGFYNPVSRKCLDVPGGRTDNGNQLQIWDCNGSKAQRWLSPGLTTPMGTTV